MTRDCPDPKSTRRCTEFQEAIKRTRTMRHEMVGDVNQYNVNSDHHRRRTDGVRRFRAERLLDDSVDARFPRTRTLSETQVSRPSRDRT